MKAAISRFSRTFPIWSFFLGEVGATIESEGEIFYQPFGFLIGYLIWVTARCKAVSRTEMQFDLLSCTWIIFVTTCTLFASGVPLLIAKWRGYHHDDTELLMFAFMASLVVNGCTIWQHYRTLKGMSSPAPLARALPLDKRRIEEIKGALNERRSEDLADILAANNRTEWTPEAFAAIRSILASRNALSAETIEAGQRREEQNANSVSGHLVTEASSSAALDATGLKELAALYQTWPTQQLVAALQFEREQYEPDAVALMEKELQRRNGLQEQSAQAASSVTREPGETTKKQQSSRRPPC